MILRLGDQLEPLGLKPDHTAVNLVDEHKLLVPDGDRPGHVLDEPVLELLDVGIACGAPRPAISSNMAFDASYTRSLRPNDCVTLLDR